MEYLDHINSSQFSYGVKVHVLLIIFILGTLLSIDFIEASGILASTILVHLILFSLVQHACMRDIEER